MRKLLGAIAAIAALAAGPAVAADMGLPPVYKAPPVNWSWTGFYAGLNAGGGIATGEYLDPCFTCADIKVQPLVGTIGGQLGYNWQWQALVAGLEGDLNWVSANKSIPNALDDGNRYAGFANFKMDAFGSIRGRMGLAYENAMVYVTGGPAFGHFNQNVQLGNFFNSAPNLTATDNSWHAGIAAGAGVEVMMTNNWSFRGEFLALMFQDANSNYVNNAGVPTNCSNGVSCGINFTNTIEVVRLGVNYKFAGY